MQLTCARRISVPEHPASERHEVNDSLVGGLKSFD